MLHFIEKCIRKCLAEHKASNLPPIIPEELADVEYDPIRPRPSSPRPTFLPGMVSSICFLFNNILLLERFSIEYRK